MTGGINPVENVGMIQRRVQITVVGNVVALSTEITVIEL